MRKIVYLTDQIYLHGGAERVLTNKVNYFLQRNLAEVYIITTEQRNQKPCYQIDPKVKIIDLEINYNREKSYFHPKNLIKAPFHYRKLKKELKQINPENIVILSLQFDYFFLPFILKRIPKIKEFHSSRHFEALAREKNKNIIKKFVFKLFDYIESSYDCLVLLTKDELPYYKSSNKLVIPNAISNIPSKSASLQNKKVISAGRIAPVKGYEKLISAWSTVFEKHPDWQLDIYGNGDKNYVGQLNEQIVALKLEDAISIKASTDELDKEILSSSIYAMSSVTECFPMVLLEAMSCGIPIVSFDCPNGPRNIIKHNIDGVLVPEGNSTALGQQIIFLIENIDRRLEYGKQAKKNVQRFNEENIMTQWINLFNSNKKYQAIK